MHDQIFAAGGGHINNDDTDKSRPRGLSDPDSEPERLNLRPHRRPRHLELAVSLAGGKEKDGKIKILTL